LRGRRFLCRRFPSLIAWWNWHPHGGQSQFPRPVLVEPQHLRIAGSRCDRCPQVIEEHEARTGEALSFTGCLAFCLARAVNEDKSVQAYLKGRKRLVIFDDVEIFLPVERELRAQGTRTAVPHVADGRAVRSLDTGAGQPSVAQPNPRLSAGDLRRSGHSPFLDEPQRFA